MQSQGQTWWQSVQPMHRGRSIVHTWNESSCRGPGMMLMQSTGQTDMHASQPVHISSSRSARVFGSFFFAMNNSSDCIAPFVCRPEPCPYHPRPGGGTAVRLPVALPEYLDGILP